MGNGKTMVEKTNGKRRLFRGESDSSDILDGLERIHLQIHLVELRIRDGLSDNVEADRLSDVAEELQSVITRLS